MSGYNIFYSTVFSTVYITVYRSGKYRYMYVGCWDACGVVTIKSFNTKYPSVPTKWWYKNESKLSNSTTRPCLPGSCCFLQARAQDVLFIWSTKPQGCWNIRFSHDLIIVGGIKSVIRTKNRTKFSKVMLLGQGLFLH